jgi:hypothetical protein
VCLVEEVVNVRTAADLEDIGRHDLYRGVVIVDIFAIEMILFGIF